MKAIATILYLFPALWVFAQGPCNVPAIIFDLGDMPGSVVAIRANSRSLCSGVVINTTANDGRPLILSAGHCRGRRKDEDISVWFNYHKGEPIKAMSGINTLYHINSTQADLWLFEMLEPIPEHYNVTHAGWSAEIGYPYQDIFYGLSHPRGATMMMASGDSIWQEKGRINIVWDLGTTERGSSGSPLFDPKGLVVGILENGEASCNNPDGADRYTPMSEALKRLSPWINPSGLPTTILPSR